MRQGKRRAGNPPLRRIDPGTGKGAPKGLGSFINLVVPIVAAVIGISLAVDMLIQRGPRITIMFSSGRAGSGKTKVKFKEVEIGMVRSIMLSEDQSFVLVGVQL